jgi:hypothetical protein
MHFEFWAPRSAQQMKKYPVSQFFSQGMRFFLDKAIDDLILRAIEWVWDV